MKQASGALEDFNNRGLVVRGCEVNITILLPIAN